MTDTCEWIVDEDGVWHTDCKNEYVIIEGTPKENKMNYCCFCGRKITEVVPK